MILSQYIYEFVNNEIDGIVLKLMSYEDFKLLDMTHEDMNKFLNLIYKKN